MTDFSIIFSFYPGNDGSHANDGIQKDRNSYYVSLTVPFTYDLDLGTEFQIAQVDLTTRLIPGSETAYQYKIETAANPGGPWRVLVDNARNTAVGFVSNQVKEAGRYRYVRLDAQKIIDVNKKDEADWARGVIELTVYAV